MKEIERKRERDKTLCRKRTEKELSKRNLRRERFESNKNI